MTMSWRSRGAAAAGSAIFFALAPGVVAGLIPWWLTAWRFEPIWPPLRVAGALLTIAAAVVLVSAFTRFVMEGVGTPAPVAPTRRLVVGGLYRFVRNPMYIAVVSAIVGQGLLLGRPGLFVYAAVAGAAMFAFTRLYEEPHLAETYGQEYADYRRNVPGWWPRLRPWKPT
jgi:protein-S-isoprenylcysteine O-methyltransferase Ste14